MSPPGGSDLGLDPVGATVRKAYITAIMAAAKGDFQSLTDSARSGASA